MVCNGFHYLDFIQEVNDLELFINWVLIFFNLLPLNRARKMEILPAGF